MQIRDISKGVISKVLFNLFDIDRNTRCDQSELVMMVATFCKGFSKLLNEHSTSLENLILISKKMYLLANVNNDASLSFDE